MPDLDILVEMADFYDVDFREILDGERKSEKMNEELKETVLKVAEYNNEEKKRETRRVLGYFVLGIVALITNQALDSVELEDTHRVRFWKENTAGIIMAAMIAGILHVTGSLNKIRAFTKMEFTFQNAERVILKVHLKAWLPCLFCCPEVKIKAVDRFCSDLQESTNKHQYHYEERTGQTFSNLYQ